SNRSATTRCSRRFPTGTARASTPGTICSGWAPTAIRCGGNTSSASKRPGQAASRAPRLSSNGRNQNSRTADVSPAMLSQVAPLPAATAPFEVVLINPYELGRQPFGLAEPAALLKREGFAVTCLDLSLQKLDPDILKNAGMVALYVGMHTATRIAVEALPHIRRLAPKAHLCVYGLYAPMNEALLRGLGVGTVLGGELEPALVSIGQRLRANGTAATQSEPVISLGRVPLEVAEQRGPP